VSNQHHYKANIFVYNFHVYTLDKFCTYQYQFLFQIQVQKLKFHCNLRVVIWR